MNETLDALLRRHAAERRDAVAVVEGETGRALTWAELDAATDAAVAGLLGRGLAPGAHVVTCLENSLEALVTMFGCWRARMVWVPVDASAVAPEIGLIARALDGDAIVAAPERHEELRAVGVPLLSPRPIEPRDDDHAPLPPPPEMDTPAMIFCTSGTTGTPKGGCLAHSQLRARANSAVSAMELTGEDVLLTILPLHWGITFAMGCLPVGARLVLCPAFTMRLLLALPPLLERHGVTVLASSPTACVTLNQTRDRHPGVDLSRLRATTSVGAPLAPAVIEEYERNFGGLLINTYGASECGGIICAFRPSARNRDHGAVGPPIGYELRIVDENDRELPLGETGEVAVRGPGVMRGYYGQPEATAAVLIDGWHHTGDLGYLDAEGVLWLRGRQRDLIIRAGLNVFPAEVERVLLQHPAVADAACFGVPDRVLGEKLWACIVPAEGVALTEADLHAHCRARLADYRRPERFILVDSIPTNARGKLRRRELQARYGP